VEWVPRLLVLTHFVSGSAGTRKSKSKAKPQKQAKVKIKINVKSRGRGRPAPHRHKHANFLIHSLSWRILMAHFSRRSFLHLSAAASAAAAFHGMTEPMLAAASRRRPHSSDAVLIDSNENPLGLARRRAMRLLASFR